MSEPLAGRGGDSACPLPTSYSVKLIRELVAEEHDRTHGRQLSQFPVPKRRRGT